MSSARALLTASGGRAQALSAGAPAASYVVTPDWPKNWLAPMWLPTRFIDRAICARFGLLRRAGDCGVYMLKAPAGDGEKGLGIHA